MKRLLSAVGLVLILAAGHAPANILYTFSSVTFDDGGTLTGTFTTNDAITALVDFNMTTSAGVGIGFNYTPATAGSGSSSIPAIIVLSTPTLNNILQVTFNGGLTALGAPITIGTFESFEQTTAPARRDITAGSVLVAASVPEPGTIGLLGIGVLGLLAARRRRRA
jgi:phosphatidylserine synthase